MASGIEFFYLSQLVGVNSALESIFDNIVKLTVKKKEKSIESQCAC